MTTMQWHSLFALSLLLFFSGVTTALPFHAQENYETIYKNSYELSSNNSDETPFNSLQFAQDSLSRYFLKRDVSAPTYECTDDTNCSFSDIELICGDDNRCGCEPPKCWHYELALEDRYLNYIFTCDDCGLLGSECSGNGTCDVPGYCGLDFFCHCDYGQHLDSMCLLASISFEHYILTTILCFILLLIVLSYCTILWQPDRVRRFLNRNNMSYGTELRNIRRARREMGRKTPAFTFTVMFHLEDGDTISESPSEDIFVRSQREGDEPSDLANGADAIEMVQLREVNPVISNSPPNEQFSTDMSTNFINQTEILPTSDISTGLPLTEHNS